MNVVQALLGGALIGLAASLLLLANGRVAGVSGITAGLLSPARGEWGWRAAFVAGLVSGGLLLSALAPASMGAPARGLWTTALAGLLVGIGTRLANGCTSGHGVCGISRGAPRSIAATATFMAAGALTVFIARQALGGVL